DKIDAYKVVLHMSRAYDIYIAPSPGDLKTRLFRMGNFGNVSEKDIIYALACLERTLIKFGHPIKPGTGAQAAISFIKKEGRRG
ncbi:MAG TPA: alanine--glyoxylate aminotransferase family protein, partial [Candidatus Omnitrophota bacterium]|nr:alanine--glyoxylate aminotransferase family protein [Candidatus Omnitrophota bacterium]